MPARTGRPSHYTAEASLEPTLADFTAESGGMFQIAIFDALATADCILAAAFGDPLANAYLQAIRDFEKKVRERKRPVCLACDFTFFPKRRPAAVAVGLGMPFMTGAVSTALMSGICRLCLEKGHEYVMARAIAHGRTIWPDLRIIDRANVMPHGGQA